MKHKKNVAMVMQCKWLTPLGIPCNTYVDGMWELKTHIGKVHKPELKRMTMSSLSWSLQARINNKGKR